MHVLPGGQLWRLRACLMHPYILQPPVNVINPLNTISLWITYIYIYIYICVCVSHAPFFENMVTRSIAAEQIKLWSTAFKRSIAAGWNKLLSTILKPQFKRIARSKLFVCVCVCVCVHMTQSLSLATWLPTAWRRSSSGFGQLYSFKHEFHPIAVSCWAVLMYY